MRILNRNHLKLLAVFLMTVNHAARVFLPENSDLQIILIGAGFFTAPVMCALLTDGYHFTQDPWRYMKRLLIFGLISQLPYMRALQMDNGNVMFTLLLCLLAVHILNTESRPERQLLYLLGIVAASAVCDWGGLLPAAAVLFEKNRSGPEGRKSAWMQFLLLFGVLTLADGLIQGKTAGQAVWLTAASLTGPAAGALLMSCFYDEKKPGKRTAFGKWFFYLYYPLHLTVLWAMRVYAGAGG